MVLIHICLPSEPIAAVTASLQMGGVLSSIDTSPPKHVLEIWVILLVILATVVVMTTLLAGPAMALILYRVQTSPGRQQNC
ncbi:hypothetical protein SKAU_G00228340 [Synaphobranchus kaupii]|uniref:Uncharacterized protein n=1 Tax=Synaphobranchus kaupii TaxID=118154 RepID=A0A9Q1F5A4_SYNKA|nr:hypothetical protein SKAU_G00228340 [Synaphobranchus kaupii]